MKTQDIRNMGQAFLQVLENQKAAIAKKLAKASASSEKGKAAVTLPKAPFEIPEDVPVDERDMFMARAAAAHKAGKTHFTMPGGKKHPVTMKKDTAQAVNSSTNEASEPKNQKEMSSLDHPAHSRVKEKLSRKKGDDEVEMNPTKKKEKKDQEMNGDMANESLVRAVYKRIIEKRDAHYKSATDPETMDDKFKGAGAKKAKSDLETGAKFDDTEEKGHEDAVKAGRVTKKSPARRGDQQTGDTNIINKPMDVTKS